jgi:hypothetical protein
MKFVSGKFVTGMVLGIALSVGASGLLAQREFHPRLAKAIEALRDARAYMAEAPHDFGGHKVEAIRATDEAIKQLEFARAYRPR